MFGYDIGFPSVERDPNAIAIVSEKPLGADECVAEYKHYWRTRNPINSTPLIAELHKEVK